MARISSTEVDAVIQDAAPRMFDEAVNLRPHALEFFTVKNDRHNNGKPPISEIKDDAGGSGTQTHSTGGNLNPAIAFTSQTPEVQQWAQYDMAIEISGLDMEQLGVASETYIVNYLEEQAMNAMKVALKAVSDDCIDNDPEGSGDANGVSGFSHLIADDNTCMGIARGSNAWFQAYENDSGALNNANLRDALDTVYDTRGGSIDCWLASRSAARTMAGLDGAVTLDYNVQVNGNLTMPIIGESFRAGSPQAEGFAAKPICIYEDSPVYAVQGMTSGVVYGFQREKVFITYLNTPSFNPIQKVQGQDLFIAEGTFYCATAIDNPWKFACKLTGF